MLIELPLAGQRADFPPVYAPVRTLMLFLNLQCNLKCHYCYQHKGDRHMSEATMRQSVDWFLDREISGSEYQVAINMFGGEPFLDLDLLESAVAYARQPRPNVYKAVELSATTNGTIAGPRVERLLEEARMDLLVSLDGDRGASVARPLHSGRDSYALVARNLPRLLARARRVVVRCTFHPGSLELVGSVRHLLELGAPSIALCPVVEADWSGSEERLKEAFQALTEGFLAAYGQGRPWPLEVTWTLLRFYHRYQAGLGRPPRPCGVASSLIAVTPEGDVMPCHRWLERPEEWLGRVERAELSSARWQYVHLKSADIQGCAGCVAEPVCGGGCRAVARDAGLGLTDPHPSHCRIMRLQAQMVATIYSQLGERPEFLDQLTRPCSVPGSLREHVFN